MNSRSSLFPLLDLYSIFEFTQSKAESSRLSPSQIASLSRYPGVCSSSILQNPHRFSLERQALLTGAATISHDGWIPLCLWTLFRRYSADQSFVLWARGYHCEELLLPDTNSSLRFRSSSQRSHELFASDFDWCDYAASYTGRNGCYEDYRRDSQRASQPNRRFVDGFELGSFVKGVSPLFVSSYGLDRFWCMHSSKKNCFIILWTNQNCVLRLSLSIPLIFKPNRWWCSDQLDLSLRKNTSIQCVRRRFRSICILSILTRRFDLFVLVLWKQFEEGRAKRLLSYRPFNNTLEVFSRSCKPAFPVNRAKHRSGQSSDGSLCVSLSAELLLDGIHAWIPAVHQSDLPSFVRAIERSHGSLAATASLSRSVGDGTCFLFDFHSVDEKHRPLRCERSHKSRIERT